MKPGMLCLLLLAGCSDVWPSDEPPTKEYRLTWICVSADPCQRTEEVTRIDRASVRDYYDVKLTSTHDESFIAEAQRVRSDTLPAQCYWIYFLTLFGHELDRLKTCNTPGGFEIEISIPNEDPTTHSKWLVSARDLALQ